MANALTEQTIMTALDFAYEKAINGVAGLDSASELAESYLKEDGETIHKANSIIRSKKSK